MENYGENYTVSRISTKTSSKRYIETANLVYEPEIVTP